MRQSTPSSCNLHAEYLTKYQGSPPVPNLVSFKTAQYPNMKVLIRSTLFSSHPRDCPRKKLNINVKVMYSVLNYLFVLGCLFLSIFLFETVY